ncbi:unnamed protein product [Trichogramma brassicae]|uniref:Uncharacterized protein n=1 Tax=Trichogramma brassicae TaxID=86971 RepID=A0A6H5IFE8_9HYME|nr:unnamed protein product [Trichogramma brassicae]
MSLCVRNKCRAKNAGDARADDKAAKSKNNCRAMRKYILYILFLSCARRARRRQQQQPPRRIIRPAGAPECRAPLLASTYTYGDGVLELLRSAATAASTAVLYTLYTANARYFSRSLLRAIRSCARAPMEIHRPIALAQLRPGLLRAGISLHSVCRRQKYI